MPVEKATERAIERAIRVCSSQLVQTVRASKLAGAKFYELRQTLRVLAAVRASFEPETDDNFEEVSGSTIGFKVDDDEPDHGMDIEHERGADAPSSTPGAPQWRCRPSGNTRRIRSQSRISRAGPSHKSTRR